MKKAEKDLDKNIIVRVILFLEIYYNNQLKNRYFSQGEARESLLLKGKNKRP
jgi:hypothetical protein